MVKNDAKNWQRSKSVPTFPDLISPPTKIKSNTIQGLWVKKTRAVFLFLLLNSTLLCFYLFIFSKGEQNFTFCLACFNLEKKRKNADLSRHQNFKIK
jgi:hypothetical protein